MIVNYISRNICDHLYSIISGSGTASTAYSIFF